MLLKSDHIRRAATNVYEDHAGVAIQNLQDVEPIMEAAQSLRRNYRGAKTLMGTDGEHVGKIPQIIWDQLVADGIAWDDDALLEWLQRPENRAWKIHPGRFA